MITNASAGTADEQRLELALDRLRARASVELARTSSASELDGVLQRAGSRRIVVAGGDGSLHAVVAALYRRNELKSRVLGLIPSGTGNDFARGTGIPLDLEEAADLILDGRVRPVDLLVDELGGVVVNSVHVGAGAQASRKAHRWKEWLGSVGVGKVNLGRVGYPIGAFLASFRPPNIRVRIEVDGVVVHDVHDPVLMVAVGNGSQVGGGTALTPAAETGDGKADVMISKAVGPLSRYGFVFSLRLGTHPDRDDVVYLRGQTVTISGERFFCSADGEVYGPERRRSWRLEPAAYSMVLP